MELLYSAKAKSLRLPLATTDKKSYKSHSDAQDQDVGMGVLDADAMKALEAIKVGQIRK